MLVSPAGGGGVGAFGGSSIKAASAGTAKTKKVNVLKSPERLFYKVTCQPSSSFNWKGDLTL